MNETTTQEPTEEAIAFEQWKKDAAESLASDAVVPETPTPEAAVEQPKPVTFADVAAASAEAQQVDEEVDYVEEKFLVELSQAEVTAREIANGDRLAERTRLETDLETKRAEAKAIKSEIDEVQAEIDQGIKETSTRRALVTKRWRVVSDFRTNTERWYDPDDGRLVDTRAIPSNRKQMSLPLGGTNGSAAPPSADDIDFDDSDDELGEEDEESGDLEDQLDRAVAEGDALDSTTNLTGDPDAVEPTDDDTEINATDILEAAPSEAKVSAPPAKPSRRGKKKAKAE